MPNPAAPPQSAKKIPPVVDPGADVRDLLTVIIGETGELDSQPTPLKIAVFHANSFPWDEVFKTLLYRDYKVGVTKYKADLFIEATI
jgi:hypothetical protein